ncbi:Lysophospholipid acyltransferase 7 [Cichlidogyrus casuarinus]|uniref:Lysophospholipid acyltransferase 7 n=1 Tax=Cichlidogyrus casuarinus TaxID=1844966 RepID=A0ABD2PLF1_9PLAT
MFQYAFCFIGLFTGPYYKFRTYYDMLEWPAGVPRPSNRHFFQRLQHLPVYAFLFFLFSSFFNIEEVKTEAFYEQPFWFRFGAMVWVFCIFRFRMYCAWIMAECLCMAALLGAYPVKAQSTSGNGPTDLKALKELVTHLQRTFFFNYYIRPNPFAIS